MPFKSITRNGTDQTIFATSDGELEVHSVVETEFEHAARTGDSWVWQSADADIDIGDTTIAVRNDSERFLVFDRMLISPANVVAEYDVGIGELTTTMAGTAIVGRPSNGGFVGRTASSIATSFGDETGLADADLIFTVWAAITQSTLISLDGFILSKGQYIQVNSEIETTSGRVALFGHFTDEVV